MHNQSMIERLLRSPSEQDDGRDLGRIAFALWLDGLPGHVSYEEEAICAYLAVMDLERVEPAVGVFCRLIRRSLERPLRPLELGTTVPRRRGGARARRIRD